MPAYPKIIVDRPAWLGAGRWILEGLTDVTVIFGRNGAGKSLLLRNIQSDANYATPHYTSPERSGALAYDQALMEQGRVPESRSGSRRQNQAPNFRRESVSRLGSLMMAMGSHREGGISPDAVFGRIEAAIGDLMPDFRLTVTNVAPHFSLMRLDASGNETAVGDPDSQLSSGEAEALGLALDLLTVCNIWREVEKPAKRLILIDEPDPHLHPDLQVRFARFIDHLVDEYEVQVVLATHSTTLLAAIGHFSKTRAGVVYLRNPEEQQLVTPFGDVLAKLAVALGGHTLIGPLFGAPILLVEGDDDYEIWSHVPRQPGFGHLFGVVPCEGSRIREHQKHLEALFSSLRSADDEPAGYALIDGDKALPTDLVQNQVKFLRLTCHESENLYLTDEVLARLGHTWAEAQALIVEAAPNYGEKQAELEACSAWDRRLVDLKSVIGPLVEILDPKRVPWRIRVGQVLGRQRPLGQLAEFLGTDVVDALWRAS